MFTLINDHCRYIKVRRGQELAELEKELASPVTGEIFAGRILQRGERCEIYRVKPLESYYSIAAKFGVDEDALRELNGGKILYPTMKLFVPRTNRGGSI